MKIGGHWLRIYGHNGIRTNNQMVMIGKFSPAASQSTKNQARDKRKTSQMKNAE